MFTFFLLSHNLDKSLCKILYECRKQKKYTIVQTIQGFITLSKGEQGWYSLLCCNYSINNINSKNLQTTLPSHMKNMTSTIEAEIFVKKCLLVAYYVHIEYFTYKFLKELKGGVGIHPGIANSVVLRGLIARYKPRFVRPSTAAYIPMNASLQCQPKLPFY